MSQSSPEEYFETPGDYALFTRLGAMGLESMAIALVMMEAPPTRLVGLGTAVLGALVYADGRRVKESAAEQSTTEGLE